MTVIIVSEWQMDSSAVDGIPRVAPAGFGAIVMEGSNTGIMEGRNPGRWMFDNDNPSAGFKLSVLVDKGGWFEFKKMVQLPAPLAPDQAGGGVVQALADHAADKVMDGGPDTLTIRTNDPIPMDIFIGPSQIKVSAKSAKLEQHFQTIFYPDPEKPIVHCHINGHDVSLSLGGMRSGSSWDQLAADINTRNKAAGFVPVGATEPSKAIVPIRTSSANFSRFPVPGGWIRPIHSTDLPLLKNYHGANNPLSWAVSLALFALTDPDIIRRGGPDAWQEAKLSDIENLVYQLTEDDTRRGQWREDVLAEIVKLHKTNRPTIGIETIQHGRTWSSVAKVTSIFPIPQLQLEYIDRKTGKTVRPTDPGMGESRQKRAFKTKGRREESLNEITVLAPDRFRLSAVRWQYAPSLNADLVRAPQLIQDGKNKGKPKMTNAGKVIRGYNIQVSRNIFEALKVLRAEGRSVYATRLLIMLAHNLHKTEEGIAADKVFKSIGIDNNSDGRPKDIVARAIMRLKQPDIGALLPGSWELPQNDMNADRRRGPYYKLLRSSEFIPPMTVLERQEEADAIGAEYEVKAIAPPITVTPPEPRKKKPSSTEPGQPSGDQPNLPGMEPPAPEPIPTADEVKAVRAASRLTIREWTRAIALDLPAGVKAPSHMTWHNIETGKRGDKAVGRMAPEVIAKVRGMITQHRPKGSA